MISPARRETILKQILAPGTIWSFGVNIWMTLGGDDQNRMSFVKLYTKGSDGFENKLISTGKNYVKDLREYMLKWKESDFKIISA